MDQGRRRWLGDARRSGQIPLIMGEDYCPNFLFENTRRFIVGVPRCEIFRSGTPKIGEARESVLARNPFGATVQPGCRRQELTQLPLGAEPDFCATILGDHSELGSPRINLQCRCLICERDKFVGRFGRSKGMQGRIDSDQRLVHIVNFRVRPHDAR